MGPTRVIFRWLIVLAALVVVLTAADVPSAMAAQRKPAGATPAVAGGGGTITNIRIEGIQRIEAETVRSYLVLQPGDQWDADRVDQSLKALYATGLFADVKLIRDGSTLVVKVVENPIINRIAFEGNSKLTDKDLNSEIQLRPRVVYTRTRVQNDVARILQLYRRHGRFAATVEPKVIQLSENRVDLVFEINEGPSTGVRSINFVGNTHFSDGTLRGIVDTKESRWYRFLSTSDTYDPDRLTYDRELLRKYYLAEGYADFRVVSAVAELTPDRDGFVITITVDEGERYHFGKVDVNIKLKDLPRDAVLPLLTVQSGDWYNGEAVEHSIAVLTDALGNRGYAFVEVKPEIIRNREDKTLDVVFDVQEGPQVYVDRIDINGNVRTLDKVIRREFRLVEGDAFNTSKMQRSQGAHQESRVLQEGRGHQRTGFGARSDGHQRRGRRAIDRRIVAGSRVLDQRRSAGRRQRPRAQFPRPRSGSADRHGRVAALATGRSELYRALFPRQEHRRRFRPVRGQDQPDI